MLTARTIAQRIVTSADSTQSCLTFAPLLSCQISHSMSAWDMSSEELGNPAYCAQPARQPTRIPLTSATLALFKGFTTTRTECDEARSDVAVVGEPIDHPSQSGGLLAGEHGLNKTADDDNAVTSSISPLEDPLRSPISSAAATTNTVADMAHHESTQPNEANAKPEHMQNWPGRHERHFNRIPHRSSDGAWSTEAVIDEPMLSLNDIFAAAHNADADDNDTAAPSAEDEATSDELESNTALAQVVLQRDPYDLPDRLPLPPELEYIPYNTIHKTQDQAQAQLPKCENKQCGTPLIPSDPFQWFGLENLPVRFSVCGHRFHLRCVYHMHGIKMGDARYVDRDEVRLGECRVCEGEWVNERGRHVFGDTAVGGGGGGGGTGKGKGDGERKGRKGRFGWLKRR